MCNMDQLKALSVPDLLKVAAELEVSCSGVGWSHFLTIRKSVSGEDVIDSKWLSRGRSLDDKPSLYNESTYEDCVEWSLDPSEGYLTVFMYNGSLLDGSRADSRCQWQVRVRDNQGELTALVKRHLIDAIWWKASCYRRLEEEAKHRKETDNILGRFLVGNFSVNE